VTEERLEREEAIPCAVGGEGWIDKGRRRFWVSVARFLTRNCLAEMVFMGLRCIHEPREEAETHLTVEVCERLPQTDRDPRC
jgi:hypothetical protein